MKIVLNFKNNPLEGKVTCKQQFVDRMIAIMNARKVKIFDIVVNKVKEYLERLGVQKQEIEQQLKMHETTIEKSEILLRRSTSAQIVQPNELVDKPFQIQGYQKGQLTVTKKSSPEIDFVKNQQLFHHVSAEQIGLLINFPAKTRPKESSA